MVSSISEHQRLLMTSLNYYKNKMKQSLRFMTELHELLHIFTSVKILIVCVTALHTICM